MFKKSTQPGSVAGGGYPAGSMACAAENPAAMVIRDEIAWVQEKVRKTNEERDQLEREVQQIEQAVRTAAERARAARQRAQSARGQAAQAADQLAKAKTKGLFDKELQCKEGAAKLTGQPYVETSEFALAGVSGLKLRFSYRGHGKAGEPGAEVPRLTLLAPRDRSLACEFELDGQKTVCFKDKDLPSVSADFPGMVKRNLKDYSKVQVTILS